MCFALFLAISAVVGAIQEVSYIDRAGIKIVDTGPGGAPFHTEFEAGPAVGDMLNFHYFPALRYYGIGRYREAAADMTYVVDRPHYLAENPRRVEFLSTAYYIRGMVYLYHAVGVGRQRLARADFEAAIKWNPLNYVAYLELSRVYSQLGLNEPAISIVRHLLELKPEEKIAQEGQEELKKLGVD